MTGAIPWMDETVAERLGWTLLHFIWQGALLALVLRAALAALRRSAAQARGFAAGVTLLAMVAAPVITFCRIGPSERASLAPERAFVAGGEHGMLVTSGASIKVSDKALSDPRPPRLSSGREIAHEGLITMANRLLRTLVPWVAPAWSIGVLLCLARLLGGWVLAERMKRQGAWIRGDLEQSVVGLARRIGVSRPVRMLESTLAHGPAVIGWLRPVIILPASAITGLGALELRAVLAHELAHIRRYDYLINLLQCGAETLLFYHPAVWWVSARIREERENACDDIAATACEDRLLLARALHALEEMRVPVPALALAARDGDLLARIRRLLVHRQPEVAGPAWPALLIMALCAGAILTQAPVSSANAVAQTEPNAATHLEAPIANSSATFIATLQTIHDDAAKKTDALKQAYVKQLQGFLRNALQAGDEPLAFAAGAEISNLNAGGSGSQESAPAAIEQARDAYQQKLQAIADTAKENSLPYLFAYAAWMQAQAATLDGRGDTAGAARVRMEWMSLRLSSPDVSTQRTRRLGGGGGGQNTDLPAPLALLVGFKVRTGDFAGHNVVTGLQAIFHSPKGTIYGNVRGPEEPGDWVVAEDGYAVGAIRAKSGDRLDGFEMVFMKINPSGTGLDPNDSYTSRWIGGHGGGGPSTIGDDGRPVVGVFGGNGLEIDSLGLIEATLESPTFPAKIQQATPTAK